MLACLHWTVSVDLRAYARSLLRVFFCRCLCLSVRLSIRLSVCHGHTSNRFFFFVSRWNGAILAVSSPCGPVALYKTLFLDFLFRPPNVQNLLPKLLAITLHYHVATRGRALGSSAPAWRKSAIHWMSGPTMVAVATKFGRGDLQYTPYRLVCLSCL